jgi:hypothetical protein
MTTTTQIAGEAMTDEWRTAFDDRHEFDVYPEHFMSGLRNEFAAGWHAAMKSQARALLASKPAAAAVTLTEQQFDAMRVALEVIAVGDSKTPSDTAAHGLVAAGFWTAELESQNATAPAQPCGEDVAEQADEAVTLPALPALPTLREDEEFVCDRGCGTTTPVLRDFEYSREEWPNGQVISKTEKVWGSVCCGSGVIVYNNADDSWTDLDDYIAARSKDSK